MSQLPLQKKVFLIPYWIKNTLERNNLPPSATLDLLQLKQVCSSEDLVLTILLNQNTLPVFGMDCYLQAVYAAWGKTDASLDQFIQLTHLAPLHQEGLQNRLFNEQAREPSYPEPFSFFDLDESNLLVMVYPGYFGSSDAPACQSALVKALLTRLFDYCSYTELAKTQLFERYMALL